MNDTIVIKYDKIQITDCESVIVVPEIAIREAGYMQTFTIKDSGHAKHEYHAMAQMAYFQFQDDELEVIELNSPVTVSYGAESIQIEAGMVIYRDKGGAFFVMIHALQNRKKILETAYRYCTRWVRLDI